MPAIISHYLLAERVMDEISHRHPGLFIHRNAYIWGASGPDIFFCHRLLPHQKGRSLHTYGTKLHSAPAHKMLNYLAAYARHVSSDICMSYALGFATHYAFDSTAHPFILYYSECMSKRQPRKHPSVCHNELESALDSILLRHDRRQPISSFPLQSAAPLDREANEAAAEALQGYFLYAFGLGVYRSEIVRAQKDWHFGLAALNDRTGAKLRIISSAEKAVGLPPLLSPMFRRDFPDLSHDPANLKRSQWYDRASQRERTESFFDLTDQAQKLSVKLIEKLLSGQLLTPEDCPVTFSGA